MGDALDSWLRGIDERGAMRAAAAASAGSRSLAGSMHGNAAVRAFITEELFKYDPTHPYFREDDPTFDRIYDAGAQAQSTDAAMRLGKECSAQFPISPLLQRIRQLDATLARSAQQSAELERVRGELNIANGEIDKANVQLVAADQRIKELEATLEQERATTARVRELRQQDLEHSAGYLALQVIFAQALKEANPDLPILKDRALVEHIMDAAATVLRSAQRAIAAGELPPEIKNPFEAVRAYARDVWNDELRRKEA